MLLDLFKLGLFNTRTTNRDVKVIMGCRLLYEENKYNQHDGYTMQHDEGIASYNYKNADRLLKFT